MTFRRFLNACARLEDWRSWGTYTRLFAIVQGSDAVRTYVSRMIEQGLGNPPKEVVLLRDIYESLWQYLTYTPNLRILIWEKGLLSKGEAAKFIDDVAELPKERKNIFFDASDELYELVREEFKGRLQVRFIDCRLTPDLKKKQELYEYWFKGVEKLDISPKMVEYLSDIPYLESFNLINIFKLVGETNFDLLSVKKWGFIWADKERFLVDTLLYKGRVMVLREDLRDLNSSRFLMLLLREINALLKIKTLHYGYTTDKAEKSGLSLGKYYALLNKAEKLSLKDLYKRLYLVVNLLKWKDFPGVINLLLMYW